MSYLSFENEKKIHLRGLREGFTKVNDTDPLYVLKERQLFSAKLESYTINRTARDLL